MKLRTALCPGPAPFRLPTPFHGVFLGSCFAERLGNRYADASFPSLVQPTGTIYHPLPLLWQLQWLSGNADIPAGTAVTVNGESRNLLFHSKFGINGNDGLPHPDVQIAFQQWFNSPAPVLVITFGTTTGYRHLESNLVVANCHTLPGNAFTRELHTSTELYPKWADSLELMLRRNTGLRVILSVSPVRHLRDGLETNMLSKAHLRILCQQLTVRFPEHVAYFPAFEIMLDDLRDYRFYGDDLVHPSEMATRYITDQFTEQYLRQEGVSWMKAWEDIAKFARHRSRSGEPAASPERIREIMKMAEPFTNRTDIYLGLFRLGIYPNTHKIDPTITTTENPS